jgi:hypothetical protein
MRLAALLLLAVSAFAQTGRTVALSWVASPSLGVTGTNVYRAAGACSPLPANFVKITATPVTGTTYSDSVPIGTYCYYVTSVGGGLESGPSTTAGAVASPNPPTGLTINVALAVTVNVNGQTVAAKDTAITIPLVVGQ